MTHSTSTQGSWTLLTLHGKIDRPGADQLEIALAPHLGGGRLALDMTDVVYVTSSGFRVLLSSYKTLHAVGGDIVIVGLNEAAHNFFHIAGLTQVFKFVPTLTDLPA